MDKALCKKINTLIALYVENRLGSEEQNLVERHLIDCPECRDKYVQMKDAIKNLRKSYENLLEEFEIMEQNNLVKEHDIFYSNISSYIDNELPYNDAVRFRKYLLRSKPAQKGLREAYSLENKLQKTFSDYSDNLRINYSKNIIEKLKKERKEPVSMVFKRMVITLGVLLLFTIAFFVYVTSVYNKQISETTTIETSQTSPEVQRENWEEEEIASQSEANGETPETLADVSGE
ncbi:zf-HC2 domain-containing protein [bacterium]|nr:zf-HC2 domain-containing protein [bacterium]